MARCNDVRNTVNIDLREITGRAEGGTSRNAKVKPVQEMQMEVVPMLAPLVPTIRLLGPSPKIILRLPRLDLTGDTYVNTDSKTRRASFRAHKLDTFDFSRPHFEFPRDDGIFSYPFVAGDDLEGVFGDEIGWNR